MHRIRRWSESSFLVLVDRDFPKEFKNDYRQVEFGAPKQRGTLPRQSTYLSHMDRLKQDLIVAFRRLRSSPGFTIAAIVTLALGIGANTTIFTAVNTVMFRSLPVDHPEQLFSVNTKTYKTEFPVQSFPNYRDTRDVARTWPPGSLPTASTLSISAAAEATTRSPGDIS